MDIYGIAWDFGAFNAGIGFTQTHAQDSAQPVDISFCSKVAHKVINFIQQSFKINWLDKNMRFLHGSIPIFMKKVLQSQYCYGNYIAV